MRHGPISSVKRQSYFRFLKLVNQSRCPRQSLVPPIIGPEFYVQRIVYPGCQITRNFRMPQRNKLERVYPGA